MSDLNEVSRAIGQLEAKVESLTAAVTMLTEGVQSLQQSKWTVRGVLVGLAMAGGAVGGKIADFLGGGGQQ